MRPDLGPMGPGTHGIRLGTHGTRPRTHGTLAGRENQRHHIAYGHLLHQASMYECPVQRWRCASCAAVRSTYSAWIRAASSVMQNILSSRCSAATLLVLPQLVFSCRSAIEGSAAWIVLRCAAVRLKCQCCLKKCFLLQCAEYQCCLESAKGLSCSALCAY